MKGEKLMFYGEIFENSNEETIWEELAYWLKNPITNEEQADRNKEIQTYIDSVLNKAFGDQFYSQNIKYKL